MLYVNGDHGTKAEWHLGVSKRSIGKVIFAMADGDELEHIKKTFTHIPMTNKLVVLWHEPWAQFIWDNI